MSRTLHLCLILSLHYFELHQELFPDDKFFVYLGHTHFLDSTLKTCKYLSIPGHIVLLESLSRLTFSRLKNENENVSSFYFVNISLNSMYNCDLKYSVKKPTNLPKVCFMNFLCSVNMSWQRLFSRIIFISSFNVWQNSPYIFTSSN